MSGRIFQLIPVLDPDDAIGNHARRMASVAGERHGGFIVERAHASLEHLATHWSEAQVDEDDILIYHVALASHVGEWMRKTKATKLIDYHNLTPPSFFRSFNPGLATALAHARFQLEELRPHLTLSISDSDFSRRELEEMGFSPTETLPIMLDFNVYSEANEDLVSELARDKPRRGDLMFVGRIAPNKRQEDLIKAFAVYRRAYNPGARLFLVGGTNAPNYSRALDDYLDRLGVEGVHLTGKVSNRDLVAYYRMADVFLSMSEHEGFGVPFVEAMHLGVPVIAYSCTAVPETLGEGGVLLDHKDYEQVAAMIQLVMEDDEVRGSLVEAGRQRVARFSPEITENRFREILETLA